MKVIKHDLGSEFNEIEIIPLGDWHIGNDKCRLDTIHKKIDYIKNKPNAYCVLLGDLLECIIKDSKGDLNTQYLTPQEQLYEVIELLEPIKHKILGITTGNHEERIYRVTSFDVSHDLAKHLGLLEVYDKTALYIFVSFGKNNGRENKRHTIRVYAKHNASNGTKTQTSVKSLEEMANIIDADIYIGGHTHTPIAFLKPYKIGYDRSKTIKQKTRAFANGGSDLDFAEYAETKSYEPKCIAFVSILVKINHYSDNRKADDITMSTKLEVMY